MTDKERADLLKALKKCKIKFQKSKTAARNFLIQIGIITKKGNLRKPYKNLRMP